MLPETWHYEFAHLALRIPFFMQPDFYLEVLEDPDQREALMRSVVARIAQNHGLSPETAIDAVGTIEVHKRHFMIGDCSVVSYIVEMPPPTRATECHFVAIAFKADGTPYYFTLERSGDVSGSTVLCRWTAEENHLNFGAGPPPDLDDFANEVARRVCVAA
jgi:hypothetical protein